MSNRQVLEARFIEQRKRREAAFARLQVAPPTHKRMKRPSPFALLILVLALLLGGTALAFLVFEQLVRSSIDAPLLSGPPATVLVVVTAPINVATQELASDLTKEMVMSDLRQVCTGVPGGRLHVRFTPGEGSDVRGYLVDGETVQAAIKVNSEVNTQTYQGSLWLRLEKPIAGWVNARYICEGD
jgi:hypothetical protein